VPEAVVIGSINMDLVIQVPRFPAPGETITGGDLQTYPGGKGANQAAALSRQQIRTAMVGKVGDDPYGQQLIQSLRDQQVDITGVRISGESATGSALISVTAEGENSIILSPGANRSICTEDIDPSKGLIASSSVMLLQLEIPLPAVEYAARMGQEQGLKVILNPAPAAELPHSLLESVDILVPNESELALLSGREISDISDAESAAKRLMDRGIPVVIVTLGDQGALLVEKSGSQHIPAAEVEVVDTTAAGDSFIGGLAAGILQHKPLPEAVRYANIAGALATTKSGAQPSLPTAAEVENFYLSGTKSK
jgi:ribokinase